MERKLKFTILLAGIAILIAIFAFLNLFGAPQKTAETENFIIPLHYNSPQIADKLKTDGFIKSPWAFDLVRLFKGYKTTESGGYKISKSMNVWQIAAALSQKPFLRWIVIPEGYRKEQIAEILARNLDWNDEQKQNWIKKDTTTNPDYFEGVYFPDTYLIPSDESPSDTATRLQNHFQEKFAPFAGEATKQNIKWTTVLKIASLIQREAAGKTDMPIIAGVIWNRLIQNMKLDIDATLQYARGNAGQGWWAPITAANKQIDSPYNTYKHTGLPPHPICNPGTDAINAVLNPAKTDCLYYLHSNDKQIHCAKTYTEHLQNIGKYLK